jgi:hypothetical protein
VQVPLLDLASYAGGLTPEELGGGLQTRSLKLKSADGHEFAFRPVDKDPSEALAPAYRGTVVDRLVQDATSAANPAAPMIAAALLDAVGVLNAKPQLFVMADQDGLGEFRDAFNGTLGYLEERPEKGFAGSSDVVEWDELLEHLAKDPSHRVDAEEFLRARLVDHLLGDWDRHRDQWRWAGFKGGRGTLWRPIPRDRDQALVRYDGALLDIARKGFGRVGMQAGVTTSTSDTAAFDEAKGALVLNGSLYPPIWSSDATFGTFAVEATGRVPIPLGPTPVVAGRLGAQRVWGAFPYDEAAFLGGQRSLRGYEYQRFAGEAMLYGSAEVRVPIAEILEHWVPTGIGVFALADIGRVWAEGEDSSKLHTAGGGGVWLSFFEERNTVSLAIASGAEGTRWHLRTGLTF